MDRTELEGLLYHIYAAPACPAHGRDALHVCFMCNAVSCFECVEMACGCCIEPENDDAPLPALDK